MIPDTSFVFAGILKQVEVQNGNLVGQGQQSGAVAAELVVEALRR